MCKIYAIYEPQNARNQSEYIGTEPDQVYSLEWFQNWSEYILELICQRD